MLDGNFYNEIQEFDIDYSLILSLRIQQQNLGRLI